MLEKTFSRKASRGSWFQVETAGAETVLCSWKPPQDRGSKARGPHGHPTRSSFLLLEASLFLVVRPGAPSSILAPNSDGLQPNGDGLN